MDILRLYWKAAAFGGKLGWKLATGLVTLIAWLIASKSQPASRLQQELTPPVRQPSRSPAPAPQPPVHVTVQNVLPPQPSPATVVTRMPTAPPAPPSATAILDHPDHTIYMTAGSRFMVPHPRAAELLERLDYILYVAAHRDGDPFTVPPALDESGPTLAELPLAPLMNDGGFDTVEPVTLAVDDGIWMAQLGHRRRRLTRPTRSLVARAAPADPAPVVVEQPLLDDEEFAPVHPRAIPLADGAVWLARADHPLRHLEASHAQM